MFDACLNLHREDGDFIFVVASFALLVPWMLFAATWAISFLLYDASMLAASALLSYGIYFLLVLLAWLFGSISPIATECTGAENWFFSGFHYSWPTPIMLATLSYYIFCVCYHYTRRRYWWKHITYDRPTAVLFTWANILGPVMFMLLGLWYLGTHSAFHLLYNAVLALVLGLSLVSIAIRWRVWRRASAYLETRMGWDPKHI